MTARAGRGAHAAHALVATLAAVLALTGCRAPAAMPDDGLPPLQISTLNCRPRTLSPGDTLIIRLPRPVGGELSIENPDGVFFQLVNENPATDMGPQLMSAAALRNTRELRLPLAEIVGLPYVYGARQTERVFNAPGDYRVRISERLNTDDGTPVAQCSVRLRQPPDQ